MRSLLALLVGLVLLPTALAGTGPFSGTVTQGESDFHYYKNFTKNQGCLDVMKWYTVVLSYTPTTDVLTLDAGGNEAVGSNGQAAVAFEASACTEFGITVTGTQVASSASYTVTVTSGYGGGA